MTLVRANLAELPIEITTEIVNYVADPKGWWRLQAEGLRFNEVDYKGIKPVQNLRLTCRSLCLAATPVLFPVLYISLSSRSIDAFEQLSKNPLIASHVKTVVVDLKTYRSDMAADLAVFKKEAISIINHLYINMEFKREVQLDQNSEIAADACSSDEDDDTNNNMDEKELAEAFERTAKAMEEARRALIEEWAQVEAIQLQGQTSEDPISSTSNPGQYGDVLLRAYTEYARRRDEQIACVNGSTQAMARIATCISRLACGGKIIFLADAGRKHRDAPYVDSGRRYQEATIVEVLKSSETLYSYLVEPHSWRFLHQEDEHDLEVAKALSRLPVALSDAGVPLTELRIGCFPHFEVEGFRHLLLRDQQTGEELQIELGRAFQHLEVFSFGELGMDHNPIRSGPLPDAELALMHAYLGAAVASPRLKMLDLRFHSYHSNALWQIASAGDQPWDLGSVLLSCANASKLTSVNIASVQITQDELLPFLWQLAASASLEALSLNSVTLTGSWVPVLDAIREAVSQRCRDNRCAVSLGSLHGAELHNTERTPATGREWGSDYDSDDTCRRPLIKLANAYVKGKRSSNPLLASKAEGEE